MYSLHGKIENKHGFVCLLFYATATVIQLYHGGDMMYEKRRRKPDSTLLSTQGHVGVV